MVAITAQRAYSYNLNRNNELHAQSLPPTNINDPKTVVWLSLRSKVSLLLLNNPNNNNNKWMMQSHNCKHLFFLKPYQTKHENMKQKKNGTRKKHTNTRSETSWVIFEWCTVYNRQIVESILYQRAVCGRIVRLNKKATATFVNIYVTIIVRCTVRCILANWMVSFDLSNIICKK